MAALVLYRKYRPKIFEEIVGQEHVVTTLVNALRLGRVGHAYLFVGPRGTGKTTAARLLARYINCAVLAGASDAPLPKRASRQSSLIASEGGLPICREESLCINCAALFKGNQPDLIEIDAASNRGVDEIRQLREAARIMPLQSPMKVYIIDEAHMLTSPAANALLKTLEEPPAHVMFILATTEAEKLPATIHSRCQRFDFRTLSVEEITSRLAFLSSAEDIVLDTETLELLSQAADGSLRDAESMLEQTLVLLGKKASRDEVIRLLGLPDPFLVREIASAILSNDTKAALEGISAVTEKGGDAILFAVRLVSYLRDVLLVNVDPNLMAVIARRHGLAYAADVQERAAQETDHKRLMRMIPKFIEAVELTKRSPIPQLPIELVIIEAAQSPNLESANSSPNSNF